MLALYVYSLQFLGRKLPRAHAGPSERCRDGRGVDTVGLYYGRYLATYAVEGAEPLCAAKGLVYYVAPLCGGRGIAASDFFLSAYGVVAGRRVVGDVELNSPSEPEHVL